MAAAAVSISANSASLIELGRLSQPRKSLPAPSPLCRVLTDASTSAFIASISLCGTNEATREMSNFKVSIVCCVLFLFVKVCFLTGCQRSCSVSSTISITGDTFS